MRRAAIYCRVSTTEQNPEAQLHPLRDYSGARGLVIAGEYVDCGVSGASERRPALDQMLSAARRREVDVVVVAKLDRLARSVRHLVTVAGELEVLGVDLVVRDQAIDTSTPTGKLTFHVLAALAEFERDLIRERTAAGVAAARRRGRHPGRPRALDERAKARAVRLRRSGKSFRAIARLLGVGASTVVRALATKKKHPSAPPPMTRTAQESAFSGD